VADVAVAENVWGPAFEGLAREFSVVLLPDDHSQEDLPELLGGVRGLVVRNRTLVTRSLLAECSSLVIVGRAGVGSENIDLDAARELGVVVSVPFGANAVSVAEHTLGLALAVARLTVPLDRAVRSGKWERKAGRELMGGTWGLLGFGATARSVATLARAMSMDVLAYDPYVGASAINDARRAGVEIVSLEHVACRADVLSVHVPATSNTRHLVDASLLGRMKDAAILVNVARGEVVDEDALFDALTHGRLWGAGLDVRNVEPPGPGRLDMLQNVVLTPHVAGLTDASQNRITQVLADDLRTVLTGGSARSAVGMERPRREPSL